MRSVIAMPLAVMLFGSMASAQLAPTATTPLDPSDAPPSAYAPATSEADPAPVDGTMTQQPVTPTPAPPAPLPPAPAAPPSSAIPQPVALAPASAVPVRPWRVNDARFVISADRVIGFHSWSYEFKQDGPGGVQEDHSGNMLNFLGSNSVAVSGSWHPVNLSAVPRVGFDALFSLATLGGALSYITTSGESEQTATGATPTSTDDADIRLLLFGMRGGFLVPWTTTVTLWPRAGLYRASYSEEGDTVGEFTATETVVSLEPVVLVTPVPHVGITFGAVVDFALAGEAEADLSQADLNGDGLPDGASPIKGDLGTTDFGITAGIAAVF